MSINESKRKIRERWPLEFDLAGIPREDRERLLAEQQILETFQESTMRDNPNITTSPTNHFAVDPAPEPIADINNPPKRPYNPRDPKNEFPKMLYAKNGGTIIVYSKEQEEKKLKGGYSLTNPQLKNDLEKESA
jgi:hypothetical protein